MAKITKLDERELENAAGGAGGWQQQAKGSYRSCGGFIVYTVANGDSIGGIAARFSVTVPQIQEWNGLGPQEGVRPGQQLTIYPVSLR